MAIGAGAIRAGQAFVELALRDDQLRRALDKATERIRDFASAVATVGAKLAGFGAALGAPLAEATKTFATFEQSMARVKALTGASEAEFDSLRTKARKLGEDTVFSASEAAEAMGFFALAGFKTHEILKAIGPTLNLAAAGQLGIAQAADITAKIMAGMGVAVEDVGGAVDILTKAMTTANTDLVQLGDAMKYVGPVAKTAGLSLEEAVGAVQMLSNAGIQGEMAGTALRGALLSLTDPSETAAEELKRLNIQVADAEGNVRTLANIVGQFETALDGMGTADRLGIIGKIFDARQASGFAELIGQGADRLREFTKNLQGAGGTAERIASTQLNTLTGSLKILQSAWEELQITVGEVFGPILRLIGSGVIKLVLQFRDWAKENRALIIGVGALAAALTIAGTTLVAVGLAFTVLEVAVSGLALAVGTVTAVLSALLTPLGLVAVVLAGATAAVLYFTGAGAAALEFLGGKFSELKGTAETAWQGISDAIEAGDFEGATRIAWAGIKLAWLQGTQEITTLWINAVAKVQEWWARGQAFLAKGFIAVRGYAVEFFAFFQEQWARVPIWAKGGITDIVTDMRKLKDTWQFLVLSMQGVWEVFMSTTGAMWARLIQQIANNWKRLLELAAPFLGPAMRDAARNTAHELGVLAKTSQTGTDFREAGAAARDRVASEQAAIEAELQSRLAAIEAERQQALAENQAALDAAKKELEAALEEARARREQQAEQLGQAAGGGPGGEGPNVPPGLRAATGQVAGTFNAAALAGLGFASNLEERTAKAAEETAKGIKDLNRKADQGGLVFA